MKVKNFAGFTAVRNCAPFAVEFQWNSFVYEFEAGEIANMPTELAIGAIKGTVYKIEADGTAHSYILPEGVEPLEPILEKTGNPAHDYLFPLANPDEFKMLPVPFADRIKHQRIQKDFNMVADGKAGDI